jgi:hypothetical protein
MGRKKKRIRPVIFCYYCDRVFESERVLIQHQRSKHFKCPECNKRVSSAHGMMVHMFQVHKETIESVPGAKSGRDSFEMEIFGMDGVPIELIAEKRLKVFGEKGSKKLKSNLGMQIISSGHSNDIVIPGTPSVFNQFGALHPLQHSCMIPGMLDPAQLRHMYGVGNAGVPLTMSLPPPPSTLPPPPQLLSLGTPNNTSLVPPSQHSPLNSQLLQSSGTAKGLVNKISPSIIPPQLTSGGQPFGGYAIPKMGMRLSNAPKIAPIIKQIKRDQEPQVKRKSVILVYENEDISQEERRAMYPKYSTYLNDRIVSLSSSIEERLKSLNG